MTKIQFDHFSYAYRHPQKVLDSINLSIEAGSFNVLIGPSRSGKTTLCLAIAGAVPHYFGGSFSGQVLVNNTPTLSSTIQELSQTIGIVLQDYETQLVTMTVEEEIAFSLENLGMEESLIAPSIRQSLAAVGLTGYEKSEVAYLSGGQKQRLVIASMLAANPKVLILDEPSSALDPEGTIELYKLLYELKNERNLTIVVVEHDISQVLPYADQFILLAGGKLMEAGSPENVLLYMWENNVLKEALPTLWRLKLEIETNTGCRFSPWKNEQNAIDELYSYLKDGEVLKGA